MQEKSNNKVRLYKKKKYFNMPLDTNNKPYWIPIVVKDKSYLLGFINACQFISEMHEIETNEMEVALSSDRLNDVLMDGSRMQDLTRNQLKNKLKELYFKTHTYKHPENNVNVLEEYYLALSCVNCGMFVGFHTEHEVPEHDLKCDVCDNTLISYINEDDDYFDFEGDIGDVDNIVEEINKENED